MDLKKRLLLLPFALLCALFALRTQPLQGQHSIQSVPSTQSVAPAAQAVYAQAQPLFPDLSREDITRLSIITPQRTFDFHCSSGKRVSVNGQQADAEIFTTLLDQITASAYEARDVFIPLGEPLLTVEVSTQDAAYSASFYASGAENSATTNVICGTVPSAYYLNTDGWRIGTLLLTCEGTRIQDASGKETPMQ